MKNKYINIDLVLEKFKKEIDNLYERVSNK